MAEPIDDAKDFNGRDLDNFAHRVANQAIASAEAAHPAARYASQLFRDAIVEETRFMLGRVVLHERQRAGREWADDIIPKATDDASRS